MWAHVLLCIFMMWVTFPDCPCSILTWVLNEEEEFSVISGCGLKTPLHCSGSACGPSSGPAAISDSSPACNPAVKAKAGDVPCWGGGAESFGSRWHPHLGISLSFPSSTCTGGACCACRACLWLGGVEEINSRFEKVSVHGTLSLRQKPRFENWFPSHSYCSWAWTLSSSAPRAHWPLPSKRWGRLLLKVIYSMGVPRLTPTKCLCLGLLHSALQAFPHFLLPPAAVS